METLVITVSGRLFLFEVKNLTAEQIESIEKFADTNFNHSSKIKNLDGEKISELFQNELFSALGITLKPIKIVSVIRINV